MTQPFLPPSPYCDEKSLTQRNTGEKVIYVTRCPFSDNRTEELETAVFDLFTTALQLYRADELMFSFNGGKDCTVVLHMLSKYYQNNCLRHLRIPVLYIQLENAFPEVDEFVEKCAGLYNIEVIKKEGNIKQVLVDLCEEMPNIKAVLMGCRRTDPNCCTLKPMEPTDPTWPPLMRINPILDWSYRDVWNYIKTHNVPYCSLYNDGYTSLGTRQNTFPNPELEFYDSGTQKLIYLPAWELKDESMERAGRL